MGKKVTPQELAPGMYISRLDHPWVETPFLYQGFEIKDQSDVTGLQGQMLEISRSLDPGSHGIDPTVYFL